MKNTAGYHVRNFEVLKSEEKLIQYFEILRGKVLINWKDMLYLHCWKNENKNKITLTIVSILPQINIIKMSEKKKKTNKTVI